MEDMERADSMESTESAGSPKAKKDKRYSSEELDTMMAEKYSKFCKLKCNVCQILCLKDFKGKSALIAASMRDTWWCKDCNRILCTNHRNLHPCEALTADLEKKGKMTKEEIQDAVRLAEEKKVQEEYAASAARAKVSADKQAIISATKQKRKVIAGKATHMADFTRQMAREFEGQACHAELLEIYPKCNAISIPLWNEHDAPTLEGKLDEEAWHQP